MSDTNSISEIAYDVFLRNIIFPRTKRKPDQIFTVVASNKIGEGNFSVVSECEIQSCDVYNLTLHESVRGWISQDDFIQMDLATRVSIFQHQAVLVLKERKDSSSSGFEDDIKAQKLARDYVSKFEKVFGAVVRNNPAHQAVVERITVVVGFTIMDSLLMVELRLFPDSGLPSDAFTKVNNNFGYVNKKVAKEDHFAILDAFSHWSYVESGGEHLVCDIQGVFHKEFREWELTDPTIHSVKREFGDGDHGHQGMNAFFTTHKCGKFCKMFGLEGKKPELFLDPELSNTVYCPTVNQHSRTIDVASRDVHDQIGGTCYAYACATILRAANNRVRGREPIKHAELVKIIVKVFGKNGGDSSKVLDLFCPKMRLRWQLVDESEASNLIRRKHCIQLSFHLSGKKWATFSRFFDKNPKEVLRELVTTAKKHEEGRHAVVIVGESKCKKNWKIKNSWGSEWANNGFCSVSKELVRSMKQVKYRHVYWLEKDLTDEERAAYAEYQEAMKK